MDGKKVELDDTVEITFFEFIEGNQEFKGLRKLIKKFLELNCKKIAPSNIQASLKVLDFLSARAKGELMTGS